MNFSVELRLSAYNGANTHLRLEDGDGGVGICRCPVVTLEQGSGEDGGGGGVKRQQRPAVSYDGEDWRCPATAEIGGVRRQQRSSSGSGVKWRRRAVVRGGGYWCRYCP
ncbi:unnamed protein product [Cuscuta europaea]|uniref:Uncharacterized protein n=1 Tax=Cuscuta europaea TaxID=41803 RepID=A0A9P0ZQG7_CUSEU|nr:unnamed protein product [Cuscuta europaea]